MANSSGNPVVPAAVVPEEAARSTDPAALTGLAVELALKAGQLALERRAAGFSVSTKSSATDVVTDADRAVEDMLRAELARRRPEDAILGEEAGDGGRADAPIRWLIDPIDGTVNFMLGLPQWAISIAAQQNGVTVAGCVVNPVSGDLFSATLGGGAYLGERRLAGPRSVPLSEAVVASGFGYDPQRRARQAQVVATMLGQVGNLRRLGSAALDLCYLAAGWIDLYFEGPLGEWDFGAGLLIAQEAGLVTSGLYGRPAGADMVAAGHPDNAAEFFALLEASGAGR